MMQLSNTEKAPSGKGKDKMLYLNPNASDGESGVNGTEK